MYVLMATNTSQQTTPSPSFLPSIRSSSRTHRPWTSINHNHHPTIVLLLPFDHLLKHIYKIKTRIIINQPKQWCKIKIKTQWFTMIFHSKFTKSKANSTQKMNMVCISSFIFVPSFIKSTTTPCKHHLCSSSLKRQQLSSSSFKVHCRFTTTACN